MPDKVQNILQECMDLCERGVSIRDCLLMYPEHSRELEPLLQVWQRANRELRPGMPSGVRREVRTSLLQEWDRRHSSGGGLLRMPSLIFGRWAVAAALVISVLAGGAGTVAASSDAMPGTPLYSLKAVREDASLWLARSPEARVDIYTRLVMQRVDELNALALDQDIVHTPIAAARLEHHLAGLDQLLQEEVGAAASQARADGALADTLRESELSHGTALAVLQAALEQAPPEAQPDIQRALDGIRQADRRVRDALKSIGTTD